MRVHPGRNEPNRERGARTPAPEIRKPTGKDRSLSIVGAAEGDIAAARLAYQRFEGWSEKQSHEHSGKDGNPIDHSMTMDEVAAKLLAEVAGATRGLPNRTQEKIEE